MIIDQINKKFIYSRRKGRAISMLVSSRKRKREYNPYEASKEEIMKYQDGR